MPGPSSAAFIFELLCRGGVRRLHEMQVHGLSRFGPVWRARFGPVLTVHVAEPALVAQVLRQEGPEPRRALSCPWKQHRDLRGVPGGLLTLEGEAWRGSRRVLARGLLRPGAAEAFAGPVAAAVAELVARLQRLRRRHPRGMVRDIGTEFNRFGLEAISWVLFSSRLGCLGDTGDTGDAPAATEAVLRSVGTVLALTLVTMALPRPLLRLVPAPWDAFCHAWDQLFAFAKGHVDRRVAEVAARGPLAEGDTCVTDLLAREHVPVASIYGNVTELLLAGVDTVASTLAWSLYELARNPGAQAALHRQLVAATATSGAAGGDSATSDGATAAATAAALGRLPLLRAVVKETLRLYPVIPANARVVPECDIRVGDYLVPRQTLITLCHYATSRDSRFFPAPDTFRPERWLRHGDTGDTAGDTAGDTTGDTPGDPPGPRHPFASLPFGLGPRSCVGRRLAELQLHMALAQILLRFEVRPEPGGGRVRPMTRTLLAPGAPISLRFLER
ncbi:25-hydroxyvitamin D-1 alpha hydroxylase, mitochondrial [Onychostruthus taczanowskii]|uniref:25-hydroxyvitamin D-1 alpha hydroxylase, mitochondrial n=1 Tax=Onychostruthus taczanowskii TaxID=356909 RepID=UPI001B809848|nr:25-hydroxyvitamin D-1 alpha hydroxylase, mitochondrial [Onychostruthus taczanowskii]